MEQNRLLTDKDMNKIIDFFTYNDIRNNNAMYVSPSIEIDIFKDEVSLRPVLFEGKIMCYGQIIEEDIKFISVVSLPWDDDKSTVVNLNILSRDDNFIMESISYFKKIFSDNIYSKLRIIFFSSMFDNYLIQKLNKINFNEEFTVPGNLGIKKAYSLILKGCND